MRLVAPVLAVALAACGSEARDQDAGPRERRDAASPSRGRDAGAPVDATSVDGGAGRTRPDAATPTTPPTPPAPEGPTGEGRVLPVRDLPLPAELEAGFEPLEVPWATLEKLLVETDAVSRGTRQSFQPIPERPWGDRPIEPFAFRKEAEPLARPGYWHPLPRLSILVVPFDPLGAGGPNVAFYALSGRGVRFIRVLAEHGLSCAGGGTLVEGLAVHSGGAEVRRVYGCNGIGEDAAIDVVRLDGRRLVGTVVRGSFLVHREDRGGTE